MNSALMFSWLRPAERSSEGLRFVNGFTRATSALRLPLPPSLRSVATREPLITSCGRLAYNASGVVTTRPHACAGEPLTSHHKFWLPATGAVRWTLSEQPGSRPVETQDPQSAASVARQAAAEKFQPKEIEQDDRPSVSPSSRRGQSQPRELT